MEEKNMKKIITKYTLIIIAVIYIIFITRTCLNQATEIRDLKDLHTTELIQKDSIQKVYNVSEKQFKTLILKQDSLYRDIIKEKDIKIKNLTSIGKITITDTITLKDTIVQQIDASKDTIIHFTEPIKCITVQGELTIKNNKIDLVFKDAKIDLTIVVTNYYDVIHWYNFRKRKEHGYSLIGFRNHYIDKTYAKAKDFGSNINIELIKIKN
jgi:hypothetical protein